MKYLTPRQTARATAWRRAGVFVAGAGMGLSVATAAPLACLIEPSEVADIGSPVMGVLASVQVERGDFVRKGATIATLRSDVERANLSAAETRAQLQAEVRATRAAAELAKSKLERSRELRAQNFISQVALEQAQSEADVAQRRVEVAVEQQRVALQDSQTARTQLAQRTIAATLDGVVTTRYLNPGERVDEKPVVRIARLNPLRVELVLPLADLGLLKVGERLMVKPEYPGAPVSEATVERVDPIVDAASRTWRARLSLPNAGHRIMAGVRCSVTLNGATPSAAAGDGAAAPAAVRPATSLRPVADVRAVAVPSRP